MGGVMIPFFSGMGTIPSKKDWLIMVITRGARVEAHLARCSEGMLHLGYVAGDIFVIAVSTCSAVTGDR